ncbi:MAG: hypothetical protein APF76_13230 [Desulfitibacter sp. BRH_c19]|nr:MAG: hypothetical protein APF76_13230 [Desulfitibacter sp. BRH_c19]
MNLSEKLIKFCKDMGFDLVGIVEPDFLKDRLDVLTERRRKGYNSRFENPDLNLRTSPQLVLPNVKSILVLGLGYYSDVESSPEPLKAQVARYTRGMDYHLVMKQKMNKVIEYLKSEEESFEYKALVDSSPLLERFLAEKIGLGWIGQNSCFYTKATGSWIFLGEILLTIELGITEVSSVETGCKNCKVCIKACPTGAIEGMYTLNPHKCLAYVTQAKEIVPKKLRPLIGSNLMGCDICQEVCPNNKGVSPNGHKYLEPLDFLDISLKDILTLTNSKFKQLFSRAAFGWCGKKVLQRNALIVLGNQKQSDAIHLIEPFLNHEDYKMRVHAAWALGQIGNQQSKTLLEKSMHIENHLEVVHEIKDALDKTREKTPHYT